VFQRNLSDFSAAARDPVWKIRIRTEERRKVVFKKLDVGSSKAPAVQQQVPPPDLLKFILQRSFPADEVETFREKLRG
jgi:hypothetical protein